jgi:hypothetical protein
VLRDGQDRRARLDQVDKEAGLSPRPKLSNRKEAEEPSFDGHPEGAKKNGSPESTLSEPQPTVSAAMRVKAPRVPSSRVSPKIWESLCSFEHFQESCPAQMSRRAFAQGHVCRGASRASQSFQSWEFNVGVICRASQIFAHIRTVM